MEADAARKLQMHLSCDGTQRQSGDHPSVPTEGHGGQSTQSSIPIPPMDTSVLLDYKLGDLFIRYKAAERKANIPSQLIKHHMNLKTFYSILSKDSTLV